MRAPAAGSARPAAGAAPPAVLASAVSAPSVIIRRQVVGAPDFLRDGGQQQRLRSGPLPVVATARPRRALRRVSAAAGVPRRCRSRCPPTSAVVRPRRSCSANGVRHGAVTCDRNRTARRPSHVDVGALHPRSSSRSGEYKQSRCTYGVSRPDDESDRAGLLSTYRWTRRPSEPPEATRAGTARCAGWALSPACSHRSGPAERLSVWTGGASWPGTPIRDPGRKVEGLRWSAPARVGRFRSSKTIWCRAGGKAVRDNRARAGVPLDQRAGQAPRRPGRR